MRMTIVENKFWSENLCTTHFLHSDNTPLSRVPEQSILMDNILYSFLLFVVVLSLHIFWFLWVRFVDAFAMATWVTAVDAVTVTQTTYMQQHQNNVKMLDRSGMFYSFPSRCAPFENIRIWNERSQDKEGRVHLNARVKSHSDMRCLQTIQLEYMLRMMMMMM